jgi:hypothetical protein
LGPYLPILLTCRRIYLEAAAVLYSTQFSIIGPKALRLFLDSVPRENILRIPFLHVLWPSWGGVSENDDNTRNRKGVLPMVPLWTLDTTTAFEEWNDIWKTVTGLGKLRRVHITIIRPPSIEASTLLPALQSVQAENLFVELYGETERLESNAFPFLVRYNPALAHPPASTQFW